MDPEVLGVGAFVTDGEHYYALFDTQTDENVIGQLPVNGDPKVILAAPSGALGVIAVDDTRVLFATLSGDSQAIWSVPKTGGTPIVVADDATPFSSLVLRNHNLYYSVNAQNALTSSIWRVPEDGSAVATVVATTDSLINAMASDSCGIV